VLSLHAIRCTSDLQFRSCTQSHSTHMHNSRKNHTPFFVLHVFLTPNPLPDHHNNSSSSLVVMMNLFIISGLYPKILWLLWQSQLFVFSVSYSQSFWLLWLLSPFLHVTIDDDHTPNQQALHDSRLWESWYETSRFSQLPISEVEPSDMLAPPLTFVDVTMV
jgi:hypothetical protein